MAMTISFDDFQELDIKIGTVKECALHPDADNLLLLQADVGDGETRQLVAGLRDEYETEELVDSQVVVVTNLEPTTIRGEKSEGMLLAADASECVSLLEPDTRVAPGTVVR